MQLLSPTSLCTSKVYKPLSPLSAEKTFKVDILLKKVIWYLRSLFSSLPSLYHLVIRSGVPPTLHSRVKGLPAITVIGSVFSKMTAGSEIGREGSVCHREVYPQMCEHRV